VLRRQLDIDASGRSRGASVFDSEIGQRMTVLTLTDKGLATAEGLREPDSGQQFYGGFVKEKEIEHDAALYRMFQAEAAKIRASGGKIRRVHLDFEIKRHIHKF